MVRGLLLLIAIWAHIWLLSQWTVEAPHWQTGLLFGAIVCLVLIVILPIRGLLSGSGWKSTLKAKLFLSFFYMYLALIIVLSLISFSGQVQVLLPIMIFLLAVYTYLIFKIRKTNKKS